MMVTNRKGVCISKKGCRLSAFLKNFLPIFYVPRSFFFLIFCVFEYSLGFMKIRLILDQPFQKYIFLKMHLKNIALISTI